MCLCVRQTWLKQACIKIKDGPIHEIALKSLGEIMYNIECLDDREMDAWAESNNLLVADAFWMYVRLEWLPKIVMWVVGNRNLHCARQDINEAIKNLKATM